MSGHVQSLELAKTWETSFSIDGATTGQIGGNEGLCKKTEVDLCGQVGSKTETLHHSKLSNFRVQFS